MVSLSGSAGWKGKSSPKTLILQGFVPFNDILLKSVFKTYQKNTSDKLSILGWDIRANEYFSFKLLGALFLPLIANIFGLTFPLLFIAIAVGFIIPDFIMNMKVKKIKDSIERVMPETIDLLSLCVGAGLNFMLALRWVIEKAKPNDFINQLRVVLDEVNVGKSRAEALRDMAKRLNISDVTSFVRILVQTDRLGTPMEEAFKLVSEDTRMRRFNRGEREAMKAPMKMLIPLIFCILPIIMIVIGGPIILKFMKGGLFGI